MQLPAAIGGGFGATKSSAASHDSDIPTMDLPGSRVKKRMMQRPPTASGGTPSG
jgi:hypothetical protein